MTGRAVYASPLGDILLAGDGALKGLWFRGQRHIPLWAEALPRADFGALEETRAWLRRYFAGEDPGFTPPLDPEGTPFQKEVWRALLAIPYGGVSTYGELVRVLKKGSPRAVGGAVGRNPISLIIPCHRVVGTGGRLTGYAGGLERKEALLRLEGGFPFSSPRTDPEEAGPR